MESGLCYPEGNLGACERSLDLVDKMKMEPLSIIDIGGGFSMDSKNPAYNFDKIGS